MLNFDSRIVQLYGACILEGCPVLVLEFMGVCYPCPLPHPEPCQTICLTSLLLLLHCSAKLRTSGWDRLQPRRPG